jgi:hypothetical protein
MDGISSKLKNRQRKCSVSVPQKPIDAKNQRVLLFTKFYSTLQTTAECSFATPSCQNLSFNHHLTHIYEQMFNALNNNTPSLFKV